MIRFTGKLCSGMLFFAFVLGMPLAAQNRQPFKVTEYRAPHVVAALEIGSYLAPNTPSIMVRGQNAEKQKVFSFYEAGSNALVHTVQMPDRALYFDFGHVLSPEQESLLFLDSTSVLIYDLAAGQLRTLVNVDSIYKQDGSPVFSAKDFAQDFNGDGLADLLIPDFGGYHLFLNDGSGTFKAHQKLDMQVEMRLSGGTPRYSQFPVYSLDANFDGLTDIAFQKDKSFITFLQQQDGSFETKPVAHMFDIDIVGNSFAAQIASNERYADQTDLAETFIETIEDINGDDIADIVTQTDRAKGLFNRSTRYAFHYGYELNGKLSFRKEPDTSLTLKGVIANPRHIDFAADGRVDFAGGAVDIGLGKIIGILLSGSVGIPVHFYEQDETGAFSQKPNFKKKVSVDFDMSSGQSSIPLVEMADLDRDGHKDLIMSKDQDRLRVYMATPGRKKMFAGKALEMQLALPKNGEQVAVQDLNGDGRDDLVIHYDRLGADGEEMKNTFLVLTAN